MSAEKLVRMANQIALFFASQPQAGAEAGVADHIRSFWNPVMRKDIYVHLDQGGEGLDALAVRALQLLRQSDPAAR